MGAKKRKGKKGKKSKKPKISQEEIRKNLTAFTKLYQENNKKHQCEALKPLLKKLQSMGKSEEALPVEFDISVTEDCSLSQLAALLEALATFPHCPALSLYRIPIKDEGCLLIGEWLRTNCHLKKLALVDCKIGTRGCTSLSNALHNNEALTHLVLDYNDLSDEGASALAVGVSWNPSLQSLSLEYCNIGTEGGATIGNEVVAKSQSLIELNLKGNPIGARGVQSIATALHTSPKLERLNLSDTSFGHSTTALSALGDALIANQTLTELNLHLNTLNVDGVQKLLEAVKQQPQKTLKSLKLYEFQQNLPQTLYKELMDTVKANGAKKKGKGKKGKKKKGKKKK